MSVFSLGLTNNDRTIVLKIITKEQLTSEEALHYIKFRERIRTKVNSRLSLLNDEMSKKGEITPIT